MNSLNSILLEGSLIADPIETSTEENVTKCTFHICSNRSYKKNDEQLTEKNTFEVEVHSNLADSCLKHLKKDRGVRVVGRIKQVFLDNDNSKVIIVAEHVEFKPVVVPGNTELDKAV